MRVVNTDQLLFALPLSEQAYAQFLQLQQSVQNLEIMGQDRWTYIWGNGQYS